MYILNIGERDHKTGYEELQNQREIYTQNLIVAIPPSPPPPFLTLVRVTLRIVFYKNDI